MNDTSPAMRSIYREMLMKRSAEERLIMGAQMFEVARNLALASFPKGLSPTEKRLALLQRFYPRMESASQIHDKGYP